MCWIYLQLLFIAIINHILSASSIGSFYEIIEYEQENDDDKSVIPRELFNCNLDNTCTLLAARSKEPLVFHNYEGDSQDLVDKVSAFKKISVLWPSCKEALRTNAKQNGIYYVLKNGMEQPARVNCSFTGNMVTAAIHHDTEEMEMENGYEKVLSFRRRIEYTSKLEDVIKFVEASGNCRQFIRIDCHNVVLTNNAALYDRFGHRISYIGDIPANGTGCECGISGSCDTPSYKCNCDTNDSVWRFDEGYMSDKKLLPLTEIRYGDTGDSLEKGRYRIGPVECLANID